MKILVTGGAGFIGSHLVEELVKKKNEVLVLDNFTTGHLDNLSHIKSKVKIIKKDIRKYDEILRFFKDVNKVFHLAALADIVPSIKNPNYYYETNVSGTLNVIRACLEHNVKKIIYTASASCYGASCKIPTSEEEKINPEYPYALTKRMGEEIIMHWGKIYKLNVTSLRLFNVYGPRSRTSGTYGAMFGVFLAQKLSNKPFTIVGNGNQSRDFTFVNDVVNAMILASNTYKTNNMILNVGSGKPTRINKIIKLLKGSHVNIPKRPGEPYSTFANINKIKKILNWRPEISIEKGIKILLNNINYWKKAPIWTPNKIKKETKLWFKYLR